MALLSIDRLLKRLSLLHFGMSEASVKVDLGRIIGCPVPNRRKCDNNPLGNECHFEIGGGVLNWGYILVSF